jgi:hypothetical protein
MTRRPSHESRLVLLLNGSTAYRLRGQLVRDRDMHLRWMSDVPRWKEKIIDRINRASRPPAEIRERAKSGPNIRWLWRSLAPPHFSLCSDGKDGHPVSFSLVAKTGL